jgi:hypothetical protein
LGVGRSTERSGAAAEYLAFGLHLGMNFQPDHGFKFHNVIQFNSDGVVCNAFFCLDVGWLLHCRQNRTEEQPAANMPSRILRFTASQQPLAEIP